MSSDWSHLFFRTRYDTKVTIKLEPLAKDHIKTYVPSLTNTNLAFDEQDKEDRLVVPDPNTLIEGIPNIILDEWAAENHETDPFNHMDKIGLGIYMIHEQNGVVPNLIKDEEQQQEQ